MLMGLVVENYSPTPGPFVIRMPRLKPAALRDLSYGMPPVQLQLIDVKLNNVLPCGSKDDMTAIFISDKKYIFLCVVHLTKPFMHNRLIYHADDKG